MILNRIPFTPFWSPVRSLRRPTNNSFHDTTSLPRFVEMAYPAKLLEIIVASLRFYFLMGELHQVAACTTQWFGLLQVETIAREVQ